MTRTEPIRGRPRRRRLDMTAPNYILYVASYDDATSAGEDYQAINDLGETAVVAAAVLDREADGTVTVKEHGAGPVGGGALVGGGLGLVVGLFAPPLLATTVIGAGIGAGVGKIMKRHEEKEIGLDAEAWLPVNSSAIVAVINDVYLDRIDKAVTKAVKKTNKAIDKDDYDAVVKALSEGSDDIAKAVDS